MSAWKRKILPNLRPSRATSLQHQEETKNGSAKKKKGRDRSPAVNYSDLAVTFIPLFASSRQGNVLRTVRCIVRERQIPGASSCLGWSEGDLDLATATRSHCATASARSDRLSLFHCQQREVAASRNVGDAQCCSSSISKRDELCTRFNANRFLANPCE